MNMRPKVIKTREPGPEFQALASDWKPTKRRAWLVQAEPQAGSADARLADAQSADALSAHATTAHADPAYAKSAYAGLANAQTANADGAAAQVAFAEATDVAGSALSDSNTTPAQSECVDSANAHPASAKAENAESATSESASARMAHANPAYAKRAPPAVSSKANPVNAQPAHAKAATARSVNAETAYAKGAYAKPAYAESAPPLAVAGGWTKVPNRLLDALVVAELSPRAVRMLLLFVRQTHGFHRHQVELSNTDLAFSTRIHISHISATVKELVDSGYVRKTIGGGRAKSRYSLTLMDGADAEAASAETAQAGGASLAPPAYARSAEAAPSQTSVGSHRQFGVPPLDEITSRNRALSANFEALKKDLKENFQRNSLSETSHTAAPPFEAFNDSPLTTATVPAAWQRYTRSLTEKTRERAEVIFESLKTRFPEDDPDEIANCPDNLRAFGAPDGTPWASIKSPHGLMEVAWPQLRDFFREKLAAKAKASAALAQHERERDALVATSNAEQDADVQEARRARDAFEATFTTDEERARALDRYKPSWVSNAQVEPGRSVAIAAWFSGTIRP